MSISSSIAKLFRRAKGDGSVVATKSTKAKKDPSYFPPRDFVVLQAEDTLFRIPRYLLVQHSQHLRTLFKPSPRSTEGISEATPFVVDGVTAIEFRHFLRIILPSVTENLENVWTNTNSVSKDEWISVLKIATLWRCLSLRQMAIHALESNTPPLHPTHSLLQTNPSTELTAAEKIALGRKYSISRWVEAGYKALVMNKKVSESEMEAIGALESFKLMRIIQTSTPYRSDIAARIQETFKAELLSIAVAEKAYK